MLVNFQFSIFNFQFSRTEILLDTDLGYSVLPVEQITQLKNESIEIMQSSLIT